MMILRKCFQIIDRILPGNFKKILMIFIGAVLSSIGYQPKNIHNKEKVITRMLNICFFDYYYHRNKNLPTREFNNKFWGEFGGAYLKTMNEIPIGEFYMKEICDAIEKRGIKRVLELGCGYLRHLEYLSNRYPHLELYGIDITEECVARAKELGKKQIIVFADDIRNLEKYKDILHNVHLIFSYGIFAYVERADLEHICKIIRDNFKGPVVYTDAADGRRIEDLTESIELSFKKYIHPYLTIFPKYGIEQKRFAYGDNGASFTYMGVQS